jgi:nitrite reductase (NADH) small subunit
MTVEWIAVATTKDLARRRKLRVEFEGGAVALFQSADRIYAMADVCIHQQRSLSKGTLLNGKVVCPGHQWQFDLETGFEEDQDRCQPTYPVRVDGDTVYVSRTPRAFTQAATAKGAQA